ncbi:MAG TPA: alpha/beta hydrolase [Stellaceae bacterium]|nr:alpha/beta hydrolase [Stellaceae bacterium]
MRHNQRRWIVFLGIAMFTLGQFGCAPVTDREARLEGVGTPRAAPEPGPAPRFAGDRFITADGLSLPLRRWLPKGPPKAVFLALHGFNDYSHAFEEPGKAWAKDGIATYAYDQRGFGAAPGRGRWPGRFALAADAATASEILRRMYPHVPLYLLGESMGGAVAVVAMTGEGGAPVPQVDGVILVAPAVWGRAVMGLAPKLVLWVGVRLFPAMKLTGRGLHIWASDNIPMLRALARDRLVIKRTRVDTVWGLVNLMDAALASAPRLTAPLLLLYGAHDEIIPKRAFRRFARALPPGPGRDRRLAYYGQGWHMLTRDLEGPLVIKDVASWALSRGAPLPSGADHAGARFFGGLASSRPGALSETAQSRAHP